MGQSIYNDGSYEENTIAITEGTKVIKILHKPKDFIVIKWEKEGEIIMVVN